MLEAKISLDSKIEDLFEGINYRKFRRYCKAKNLIYLHQLKSTDFSMYKTELNTTNYEKNIVLELWNTLINTLYETSLRESFINNDSEKHFESTLQEEKLCMTEFQSEERRGDYYDRLWARDIVYYQQASVADLINRIDTCFCDCRTFITAAPCEYPVKWEGLSEAEIETVNKNPGVFCNFSTNEFIIIKWIIDEINCMFDKDTDLAMDFDSLCSHLEVHFKVKTFNRERLRRLLEVVDLLEYSNFKKIREKYLREYYKMYVTCRLLKGSCEDNGCNNIHKSRHLALEASSFLRELFKNSMFRHDMLVDLVVERVIDMGTFNKLLNAKNILGSDECYKLVNKISYTETLTECLDAYIKTEEETSGYKITLSKLIETINKNNYNARLFPLLKAVQIDGEAKKNIKVLLEKKKIYRISDLHRLSMLPMSKNEYIELIAFIRELDQDYKQLVRDEFAKLNNSDKEQNVIKRRAAGESLVDIASEHNASRERFRQMEKRFFKKFEGYLASSKAHFIISAFSQSPFYISIAEIKDICGEEAECFIHCLKGCSYENLHWLERLECFTVGDASWYIKLKESLGKLPETINTSELDCLTNEIIKQTESIIGAEVIKNLIISEYKIHEKNYLSKKMCSSQMYLTVLEKYFSDGIRVHEPLELKRFRSYVKEMFGNNSIGESDKTIAITICRLAVLCDRGKYILPDKIKIPMELLERIRNYIKQCARSIIMFTELFEHFKGELIEKTNITNRYFLQGVLRYHYPTEYFYTPYTLNKDNNSGASIKIAIEEFIRQAEWTAEKEELKEEFAGISNAVLTNACTSNSNIVMWESGRYVHAEKLKIYEADYTNTLPIIQKNMHEGFVASKKLFKVFSMFCTEFLRRNRIENHNMLFGVLFYMFKDTLGFKKPYISQNKNMICSKEAIIRDYLSEYDTFKISELRGFCTKMQIRIMNFETLIDNLRDEFIRIDFNTCVRKHKLNINQDVINKTEEATSLLVNDMGFVSLRKIINFLNYPEIGVKWTQTLLESIICEYSSKFKVIDLDYRDYRYVFGIIIYKRCGINTYEELLRYALKTEAEHRTFNNLKETEKWLKDQELILKEIPRLLFLKGIISQTENGEIVIK